ncbi:MAG: hypothetical protein L6Q76_25945, partial [Polyangiaceae bacterium]|nr:hypothetical protein [Polyangiaceae bacterium]
RRIFFLAALATGLFEEPGREDRGKLSMAPTSMLGTRFPTLRTGLHEGETEWTKGITSPPRRSKATKRRRAQPAPSLKILENSPAPQHAK